MALYLTQLFITQELMNAYYRVPNRGEKESELYQNQPTNQIIHSLFRSQFSCKMDRRPNLLDCYKD